MNGHLVSLLTTMYIEINDDIVRDAIDKSALSVNDSRDVLLLMALAARSGKHIVVVPCLKDKALVQSLMKVIPRPYIEGLRRSMGINYALPLLKKELSNYAVISYEGNHMKDTRAIIVNPQRHKIFEVHVETQLLTENLMDAAFFNYLVQYFKHTHHIKARSSFHALMGGGGTTADVLRKEIEKEQYFCLAIVDGDRKTPKAEYGDTAKRVMAVMNDYAPFHCHLYVMKEVLEVENLIPISIVKDFFSERGDIATYMLCPSFFDLKKGLTFDALYDDNVYDYWKTRLEDDIVLFQQRDEAKTASNSRKEYMSYVESHRFETSQKKGMGNDLLECCVNSYGCKRKVDLQKLKEKLMHVKCSDLTSCQREEWESIGKIVFSWTCGLEPNRS